MARPLLLLALTAGLLQGTAIRAQEPTAGEVIEINADVVYGHKLGLALTYDVLRPTRQPNGAAVLFMVSGGWKSSWSPPESAARRFRFLLERGFTMILVRHGSSPKYDIPEIVADVRRSVRFIRSHAAEYSVDPDRLGVYGGSAGGHLSLVLGMASDNGNSSARDEVDRVIGNLFGWGLLVYIMLLAGYFIFKSRVSRAEDLAGDENVRLGKMLKEEKRLTGEYQVLWDQLDLRETALSVLNAVSIHMPEEITLDAMVFKESRGSTGNNITLRGKVEQAARQKLQGYSDRLRTFTVTKKMDDGSEKTEALFSQVRPPEWDVRGGGYIEWYIICLLRREGQAQ